MLTDIRVGQTVRKGDKQYRVVDSLIVDDTVDVDALLGAINLAVKEGRDYQSVLESVKGGPGSGNFGHAGRPGKRGGSATSPGVGNQASYYEKPTESQVNQWAEQIKAWPSDRKGMANNAIHDIQTNYASAVIIERNGELKAINSIHPPRTRFVLGEQVVEGDNVSAFYGATKESGYGLQMLRGVAQVAADGGWSLSFGATGKSVGFFLKIGLTPVSEGGTLFFLSNEEVREWLDATSGVKAMKLDVSIAEVVESEPDDGVFFAQGESVKGGPGSGNFGHAGRPGERGGSLAGSSRVPKDYFTTGPGSNLFADNVSPEFRQQCIKILTDPDVRMRHIEGLKEIRVGDPPPTKSGWTDEVGTIQGYHERSKIVLNPNLVESGSFTYRDSPHQDLRRRTVRQTLAHEFGHHVLEQSYWQARGEEKEEQEFKVNSAWLNLLWHLSGPEKGMEVEVTEGSLLQRGGRPIYQRGQEYPKVRASITSDYNLATSLASLGLRRYSISKVTEFMADAWVVNHLGTSKQKAALADALNVDSLEDLF